ncbi:MAG: tetratricopeptide repeat protein [Sideroxydans sp.]|nr:tetratricopeptide repeat protein [Sideroxydans sp.]
MSRNIFHPALAFTLSLLALSAQASSCDPAAAVDTFKANYEESVCAKNALETVDGLVQQAAKSEQRGEFELMCKDQYSALVLLDKYKTGEWRADFKYVAGKVDAGFSDVLNLFMKTSCRQKTDIYRLLAEEGDAWAMYNLGLGYSKGVVLPQDDAQALAWYTKAAEKEYTAAYIALGVMYSDGAAFAEDYPVAFEWFMKAAMKGDASAQFNVAGMYRKGVGVKQDVAQAAEWYKKAADQNHEGAKAKLEEMYKSGEAKKPKSGGFW